MPLPVALNAFLSLILYLRVGLKEFILLSPRNLAMSESDVIHFFITVFGADRGSY
jgi:hypothetical protein